MIYAYMENIGSKISGLLNANKLLPNFVTNDFEHFSTKLKDEGVPDENLVLYIVLFGYSQLSVMELRYFIEKEIDTLLKRNCKLIVSTTVKEYLDVKKYIKNRSNVYFSLFERDPILEMEVEPYNLLTSSESNDKESVIDIVEYSLDYTKDSFNFDKYANKVTFIKTDLDYIPDEDYFKIKLKKGIGETQLRNEVVYSNEYFVEGALDYLLGDGDFDGELDGTDIDVGEKVVPEDRHILEFDTSMNGHKSKSINVIEENIEPIKNHEEHIGISQEGLSSHIGDIQGVSRPSTSIEQIEEVKKPKKHLLEDLDISVSVEEIEDITEILDKVSIKDRRLINRQGFMDRQREKRNERLKKGRKPKDITDIKKKEQLDALHNPENYSQVVLDILRSVDKG